MDLKQGYIYSLLPAMRALATLFMREINHGAQITLRFIGFPETIIMDERFRVMMTNSMSGAVFGGSDRKCPSINFSFKIIDTFILQFFKCYMATPNMHQKTQSLTGNNSWFWNIIEPTGKTDSNPVTQLDQYISRIEKYPENAPLTTPASEIDDLCIADELSVRCKASETQPPTFFFGLIPGVDGSSLTYFPNRLERIEFSNAQQRVKHVEPKTTLPLVLEGFGGKIQGDPRTGVPVFSVYFFPEKRLAITATENTPYQPTRPLGQVKFYGVPHPCKSLGGFETNVVSTEGIVPEELTDPQSINAICDVLPPTILDAGWGGAKQGFFRAVTNVVGAALCPKDISKRVQHCVQTLVYDSCYFGLRFNAHLAEGKSLESTCYEAAVDTFWMAGIDLSSALVHEMGQKASKHGLKRIGSALSIFSQAAPLAYTAHQQGVVDFESRTLNKEILQDIAAYMLAAKVAQTVVESTVNCIRPSVYVDPVL